MITAVAHRAPPRRFLADVLTVFGGQLASIAIALITEICYARLLGPEARGQLSLCTIAIAFGVLLGGLGGDIPIVIWSAERKTHPSRWLIPVIGWGLLGSTFASALLVVIYRVWHLSALRGVTPKMLQIVLISVPLAVLLDYAMAYLTGRERFRARAMTGLADSATGLVVFLLLASLAGATGTAAMNAYLAGICAGLIVAIALLWREPRNPGAWRSEGGLSRGLLTGLRGQLGNIAAFFNYRFDVFIVNYFLEPAQVGLYALGVAISESIWQIPQATAVALFPHNARTGEQGSTRFTCSVLRHVFLIALLSAAIVAVISPFAVPAIFGSRFRGSVAVIWWILPGTAALALGKIASSALAARHKTGYASLYGVLSLMLGIALDVVWIPRFGIEGAAAASSASYLFNACLLLYSLKRELNAGWQELFVPAPEEFLRYRRMWLSASAWLSLRT
jgi:O-antigen/teichoic acid export membrane protein